MSVWAELSLAFTPMHTDSDKVALATGAIKQWFERSSPTQERIGDFACASFDEHVRCVLLDSIETDYVHVDVSSFLPVRDAFIIFYTHDAISGLLKVRGGVTYTALVLQNKGYMRLRDVEKSQCRAFFPPYHSDGMLVQIPIQAAHFYWYNCFGEPLEYASMAGYNVSRDAFSEKMSWYRACEKTGCLEPLSFSGTMQECARIDKATSMMARLVADCIEFTCIHIRNTPLDPRKLRVRYDTWRFDAERKLFMHRMSKLTTEMSLLHAFNFNNLTPMLERTDIITDGFPLDHQVFFAQHGKDALYEPTMFLSVPVEDVPAHVGSMLPLYAGGKIHLPFYWEYVAEWLWQKYMVQMQQHYTLCRSYNVKDALLNDWIKFEQDVMIRHMMSTAPGPEKKVAQKGKGKVGGNLGFSMRQRDDAGTDVSDIEDLVKIMPPCMRAIHENGRFPKNLERFAYVKVLWAAGLSRESIIAPLRSLNDRYPKDGGAQTLENRFNVEGTIDNIEKMPPVKQIVWCTNVINDTLLDQTTSMNCPPAEALKELHPDMPTNKEAFRDACRHKCCSTVSFKAPHKLMTLSLKQTALPVPQQSAPSAAAPVEAMSESEESEEGVIAFGNFEQEEEE